MATGDITSCTIGTDGSYADIVIAGLATGGTYNFGLGTNNDPVSGTPKVVFSVTRMGFDDTGAATTIVDTVYGITSVLKAWPNSASPNESGGSPVTVRIGLSEPIYQKETTGAGNSGALPTVTISSGFYTSSGTPNNAISNLTVVNNSTLAYPKVVANWSWPGYGKCGATQRLKCVAFHKFARLGRMVRCVVFTITDTHSHTSTVTVTNPTIDTAVGDAIPVIEYLADMTTSGFTQNDIVTANFVAYPWVGDSAACLDTSAGTSPPTPLYGPQKYVADPNGTYNTNIAVVDAANGSDSTGNIANNLTSAALTPFASIGKAYDVMRAACNAGTNVSASRNNPGGGTIYLRDNAGGVNNFTWLGATTPTIGTDPDARLTIAIYPGHSRSNVVLSASTAGGSNHDAGKRMLMQGIKITASNANGLFAPSAGTDYWWDNCEWDVSSNGPSLYIGSGGSLFLWHLTRCKLTNMVHGIRPYSNNNIPPSIIRGNDLNATTFSNGILAYVFIGNTKTNSTYMYTDDTVATGGTSPAIPNNQIIAFNKLTTSSSSLPVIYLRTGVAETQGLAVVQNLIECLNSVQPGVQIGADASSVIVNNVIFHNNVVTGGRANLAYNEYGATALARSNWSIKNNIIDDWNIKSDTFYGNTVSASRSYSNPTVTVTVTQTAHQYVNGDTVYWPSGTISPAAYQGSFTVINATANTFQFTFSSGSDPGAPTAVTLGPNPGRNGNWPIMYGCGISGNALVECVQAGGSFLPAFAGLRSYSPSITVSNSAPPASGTNLTTYPNYVDRESATGSNGVGGGDYRLRSASPFFGLQLDNVMPFDLNGVARRGADSAGCYAAGAWRGQMQLQNGTMTNSNTMRNGSIL